MTVIERPGLYRDMPNEAYHAARARCGITGEIRPIISKSGLTKAARSWRHFRAAQDHPRAPTPAMQFGTAAHACVLEHDTTWQEYAIRPAFRGTGSKKAREEWEAENAGRPQISAEDHAKCERMRNEVMAHPESSALLSDGWAEVSAFQYMDDLGIWVKVRPDFINRSGVYVEFKSTPDARPDAFSRVCNGLRYHWHCLYLDVLRAVAGLDLEMVIVASEVEEPHLCHVHRMPAGVIDVGRVQVRHMLEQYAECMRTGYWPGYPLTPDPLRFSSRALEWNAEADLSEWEQFEE